MVSGRTVQGALCRAGEDQPFLELKTVQALRCCAKHVLTTLDMVGHYAVIPSLTLNNAPRASEDYARLRVHKSHEFPLAFHNVTTPSCRQQRTAELTACY